MRIDRREFLGVALGGAAGMLVADRLAVAAPSSPDATALVPLGKHLKVPRLGFGTGMKGYLRETNQTRLGEEGFGKLLHYCYDQNIRLFDMADLYGTHGHVARGDERQAPR